MVMGKRLSLSYSEQRHSYSAFVKMCGVPVCVAYMYWRGNSLKFALTLKLFLFLLYFLTLSKKEVKVLPWQTIKQGRLYDIGSHSK